MKTDLDCYQPNPDFKDQIHCLLYVINSKTDLSNQESGELTAIKEIRRKHTMDGNAVLFSKSVNKIIRIKQSMCKIYYNLNVENTSSYVIKLY